MQGNKTFVKYQGTNESNSEAESTKDVDNINMLLYWKQKIINLTTLSSLVAP